MPISTLVLTALLVIVGAAISGMAGFGFAIVTMPFYLMLYPPKTAVAISVCCSLCGVLVQLSRVRRHVHVSLVARLAAGALLGLPLGGLVLAAINPLHLKLLIGLAVLVAATLGLVRREQPDLPTRQPPTWVALAAGFAGGLLNATVAQPGPPVSFLLTWARLDKAVVRATLVGFFAFTYTGSMITLARGHIVTWQLALTGFGMLPFYLAGLTVGDRIFHRISQGAYRRVVLGVLSLAALVAVGSSLAALVS